MKINDLVDLGELGDAVGGGWVTIRRHPRYPQLAIANYTDACAFARMWNDTTRMCRGLIWDSHSLELLARPFGKFFNYGEPGAPEIPLSAAVEVTDKLDGSLGIVYPTPDGQWSIATRGSFDSEQARHATELFRARYADGFTPPPTATLLVEIMYPGNRIVVDYGSTDDLFLLGAVDITTGITCGPNVFDWPGPRAATFGCRSFAEALALPPRRNAEGIVVRQMFTDIRVKIKQEDYKALHRVIFGCTKRRLWEHLAVHDCKRFLDPGYLVKRLYLAPDRIQGILDVGENWLDTYLQNAPEEFRSWVVDKVAEMTGEVERRAMLHRAQLLVLCAHLGVAPPGGAPDRALSKRFTELTRKKCPQDFHMVMGLWRGQEITSELWRQVRPEHELPFRVLDEAVA